MFSQQLRRSWLKFATFYRTAAEAIHDIKDGSFILSGGFGLQGLPMNLINAIRESKVKNLVVASTNAGLGDKEGKMDWGTALLLRTKQIKRMVTSYVGQNYEFEKFYFMGQFQLDICPQGTLAQKIRAGGAGIPAFYTSTGVGTMVQTGGFPIKFKENDKYEEIKKGKADLEPEILAKPKKTAVFDGKKYLLEESLFGDFSIIKAKRADTKGNLQFEMSERNFNQDMAKASRCVIAEVEEIVEAGEMDPENIHVPGVFVDRIFKSDPNSPYSDVKIEKLVIKGQTEMKEFVSERDLREGKVTFQEHLCHTKKNKNTDPVRLKIAKRAVQEVHDGMYINLGIGIPTLLPSLLPKGIELNLHSQNGIMGVGPYPTLEQATGRNINASKETITLDKGGSYFSSSESFAIIRGGHLDMTMLGAMEVSQNCDIANWMIPVKLLKGMGGAMDLVASGSKVVVLMEHFAKTKDGRLILKLLPECDLPLTAKGVVSKVITELAVFENREGKLILTELSTSTTLEQVQSKTGFKLRVAEQIKRF